MISFGSAQKEKWREEFESHLPTVTFINDKSFVPPVDGFYFYVDGLRPYSTDVLEAYIKQHVGIRGVLEQSNTLTLADRDRLFENGVNIINTGRFKARPTIFGVSMSSNRMPIQNFMLYQNLLKFVADLVDGADAMNQVPFMEMLFKHVHDFSMRAESTFTRKQFAVTLEALSAEHSKFTVKMPSMVKGIESFNLEFTMRFMNMVISIPEEQAEMHQRIYGDT